MVGIAMLVQQMDASHPQECGSMEGVLEARSGFPLGR